MKASKAIVAVALFLAGWLAGTAKADFVLDGTRHLDVTTSHNTGILDDNSTAAVLAGGHIGKAYVNDNALLTVDRPDGSIYSWAVDQGWLYNNGRIQVFSAYGVKELGARDTSSVHISGGSVSSLYPLGASTVDISSGSVENLPAGDASTVHISGGSVHGLGANDTTTMDISGGSVSELSAYNASTVDISGGSVNTVYADGASAITFYGYDFHATGGGLSLVLYDVIDGVPQYKVLGRGVLTGKWRDGTSWFTNIFRNDSTTPILAIPEPATISLLALGGLAVLRRRRRMA